MNLNKDGIFAIASTILIIFIYIISVIYSYEISLIIPFSIWILICYIFPILFCIVISENLEILGDKQYLTILLFALFPIINIMASISGLICLICYFIPKYLIKIYKNENDN